MSECIFCRIVAGDAKSWKVHETDEILAYSALNKVSTDSRTKALNVPMADIQVV